MANELRNQSGNIFWSDECADAVAAINFALDDIEDQHEQIVFLEDWREGDVSSWPEFIKKVSK